MGLGLLWLAPDGAGGDIHSRPTVVESSLQADIFRKVLGMFGGEELAAPAY